MSDVGPDLGMCEQCGEFREVVWHEEDRCRCAEHAPVVLKPADFDMIFEKAGVPGPKRHRPWEGILGILGLSKKHHKQAVTEIERISFGRLLE